MKADLCTAAIPHLMKEAWQDLVPRKTKKMKKTAWQMYVIEQIPSLKAQGIPLREGAKIIAEKVESTL